MPTLNANRFNESVNSLDKRFGLVVIGDEILGGRRRDRHFQGIGELLRDLGYELHWLRILPDDPEYLVTEFRRTMEEDIPVFSCGGIGATPDDYTRFCAAEAAGVPLVRFVIWVRWQRSKRSLALTHIRRGYAWPNCQRVRS